jgi:hypothetical protein
LLVLVSGNLVDPGAVAWAEPPKQAVTNIDSIRHFMEKGQSLFISGQHLRAAEVFDAGYELHPYSAFLFNAGVALEKAGKLAEAIEHFQKYIEVDPKAPDSAEVKKRIARVEATLEDQKKQQAAKKPEPAPSQEPQTEEMATKSLVILETEPKGATLRIFRRTQGDAPLNLDKPQAEWEQVLEGTSPMNASLDVGAYHVIVDPFQDNNRGDTAFEVQSGHVLQVKVNLSQGQFMAHLRVRSNVPKARVYLDDPELKREPWGRTPFGDFLPAGDHVLVVAATGYETVRKKISLARSDQGELEIPLQRLPQGRLRVTSNVDESEIFIDGKWVGKVQLNKPPMEVKELPAGAHHLRISAKGRKPVESSILIPKGQAIPVYAHLVVLPPRGAAWTQAIISGVLLGGGIYMGLESNRHYDELSRERRHGTLSNDDPRALRGKIYAIGADVSFVGSAILGGLATYNFIRDPLPPSRLITGQPVEFDAPNVPIKRTGQAPPIAVGNDEPKTQSATIRQQISRARTTEVAQ